MLEHFSVAFEAWALKLFVYGSLVQRVISQAQAAIQLRETADYIKFTFASIRWGIAAAAGTGILALRYFLLFLSVSELFNHFWRINRINLEVFWHKASHLLMQIQLL